MLNAYAITDANAQQVPLFTFLTHSFPVTVEVRNLNTQGGDRVT